MSVRVSCPSCGGPVVFEVGSSMVAVCPYCRSAVARGDRDIVDMGKVADLVDTAAILRLNMTGKYDGIGFRLTGRVQQAHEAGGLWDEWYVYFDDNRWGWLSEAQGRFYMLFEQQPAEDRPPIDTLVPGRKLSLAGVGRKLAINETGTATAAGAEGEIPYRYVPGATYQYADLSGAGRTFATLDYSMSPPGLYLGRQVKLDELGIPELSKKEAFELREVAAKKMGCPNCGGPLELKAPDKTERVGCPYCGSLLDATQGDLTLLQAMKKPKFRLDIPLGTKGKLNDRDRTVIGAIRRSVRSEGVDYPWTEYLLYHERDGFEWLVESNGHWSHVVPVPVASVSGAKNVASFEGKSFRKFQMGNAKVRGVLGECYWKVQTGDMAETADFIRPPEMLSCEREQHGTSQELNWSLGTYTKPEEVQLAFALKEPLPTPEGVAPNQPFPHSYIYRLAAIFLGVLCVLGLILLIAAPVKKVHEQTFTLGAGEATKVIHTDPIFELRGNRNIRVTASAPNLNGGLTIEGDLVHQENGESKPFVMNFGHYSGVEEGEAWTEGSHTDTEVLHSQPPGHYSLRLEVERENATTPETLTVKVEQGVPRLKNWFLALFGIGVIPLCVAIYHLIFTQRRWANSDLSTDDQSASTTDDSGGSDD